MPEYSKDVMIAVMGAAVGLAGLLLVVAGYVFAQANSFPSTTDDDLLERYQMAGKIGINILGAPCDLVIKKQDHRKPLK